MKYQLTHTTSYDYGDSVSVSHHVARVTPRSLPLQDCHSHQIEISPSASLLREHVDHFGNRFHFFSLQTPYTAFTLTARSIVEVRPGEIPECGSGPLWGEVKLGFLEENWSGETSVLEFIYPSPLVPRSLEMAAYASESFHDDSPFLQCLLSLTERIHADFAYDPRATTVATPLTEVWKTRRGVCQDFAHLELACLRSLGIPARYVSGYVETVPPPGVERLTGADASHAWLSVFCPSIGWVDLDPTNNLIPSTRHIVTAWGRDFSDVSPLRGVILGGSIQVLKVSVDVAPLPE
jgi:transglutaminase-like putative cysteine protease